jgi:dTDP-glucose 4,6-dehydratase
VAGDGSQTRSVCYVDDLVAGVLAFAATSHAGPVNIGNPDEMSVLQIARDVLVATGSSASVQHVELPVDDPKVRRPDTSHAEQALGWRPTVSSAEGLRQTVAWFASQREALAAQAG